MGHIDKKISPNVTFQGFVLQSSAWFSLEYPIKLSRYIHAILLTKIRDDLRNVRLRENRTQPAEINRRNQYRGLRNNSGNDCMGQMVQGPYTVSEAGTQGILTKQIRLLYLSISTNLILRLHASNSCSIARHWRLYSHLIVKFQVQVMIQEGLY